MATPTFTNEDLWEVLSPDGSPSPPAGSDPQNSTNVLSPGDLPAVDQAFDFDDDDDFEDDPGQQGTIQNFAASPIARLGLVGIGTLAVVMAIGAMVGGFNSQVKESAKKEEPSTAPTPFASPMVPGNQQANGELKAQMAFQSQKQALQNQSPDAKPSVPPSPTIKSPPKTESTAVPVAAPPPPVAVAPAPLPPDPIPATPAPLPNPSPIPVSPIPLANLPPIDPNKAWNDLAQSATYGSLPVMITPPAPPAPVPVSTPAPKPQPQSDMGGLPSLSSYQLQAANPGRKLRIGTQVKATLLNPIAWSGDGKDVAFSGNGAPTPKFIARLEQPLKDMDGNEVVPQGAEIVIAVRSLEPRSGMAELTALQMIIDNQEYAPPIGAITLRGANGNPLIADKFQDKGKEIAAADRSMFFFGALSKVGELLNRTDSNVVITAGGSSSSSSSGKPNVLGGILQGGFGALAQQQQQRNQQWLQEIIQRPDIRYIPAGKELSLYINQTVTL
jgi:hypothetical protein